MAEANNSKKNQCNVPECEEVLDYLPFKCKYCGLIYCKKHRLPENHNCPMDMSRSPPISEKRETTWSESPPPRLYQGEFSNTTMPKRNNRRRQESDWSYRPQTPFIYPTNKMTATYWIIGINIVLFILSSFGLQGFLWFSLDSLLYPFYYYHTIITALFIPDGLISAIFSVLIFYNFGKMIELRFGPKLFLFIYFLTGLSTLAAGILLQYAFGSVLMTANNGIFYGFLAFFCFLAGLNTELNFFFFFIPVRLKAKYILIFIIGLNLIFGFISLFGGNPTNSFASLMGIVVAKVIYDKLRVRLATPSYY